MKMIDEYCAILTFKVPPKINAVCLSLDAATTNSADPYHTAAVGAV